MSAGIAAAPNDGLTGAVRGDLIMTADLAHDDTPQAGRPEVGRRRWAVLAVVSAAQFLVILDLWVVNIALPVLQRDFATARQIGAALGVSVFVAVLGVRPARDLAGFDRAWIIVLISATMTAMAGLATGRRPTATSAGRRSLLRRIAAWSRSDRLPPRLPPPVARGETVVLRDKSAVLIRQVQSAEAPLLAGVRDRAGAT